MINTITSHAERVITKSRFYRNRIVDKSISYRNQIVDISTSCRDQIVDISLSYRDQIVTTSLYCKDHVLDAFFDALKVIPVHYRNGEFILLGRDDFCDIPARDGADEAEMKQVYVLLTKHSNMLARLLRLLTFHEYTHSSIALERDGTHYSFNPKRGFTAERPIHKKRGTTPCRLYCIDVPERTHAEIEARIKWFVDNPDEYKFNYVGLAFSIMHIPIGFGNRYFCSQFVSDLLTSSDAAQLLKRPNSYFPRHFPREDGMTLLYNGTADSFDAAEGGALADAGGSLMESNGALMESVGSFTESNGAIAESDGIL